MVTVKLSGPYSSILAVDEGKVTEFKAIASSIVKDANNVAQTKLLSFPMMVW